MLFAQIISFILVLVVFDAYRPLAPQLSAFQSFAACLASLAWLWLVVHVVTSAVLGRINGQSPPPDPARHARRALSFLSALAVIFFLLIIAVADFKAQILRLPWLGASEFLSGLVAVGLYFLLLGVVWFGSYPLERRVLNQELGRWAFVLGQARFVLPVAFPWFIVSVLRDALHFTIPGAEAWLATTTGDLLFLAVFLLIIALLFPPMVRAWWGCTDWPDGPVRELSQAVLDRAGVKVGAILSWNVLQGKLITAGVLGLFTRLRYLLLSPALVEALGPSELAGVVAHEAGHAKLRHVPIFLLFFMGFFVAAYALSEPLTLIIDYLMYLMAGSAWGAELLTSQSPKTAVFGVLFALPMLGLLIVYLRFVMGFFMRHFERQADLFALDLLGDPEPLTGALEKVALLSGNTREVPSWHHFSIAQRVRVLWEARHNPRINLANQGRLLKRAFRVYLAGLILVAGIGVITWQAEAGRTMHRELVIRLLAHHANRHPAEVRMRMDLGVLRFEAGHEKKALRDLTIAHDLSPRDPEVQNSLAWLLATAKDQGLRDPQRAVALAKSAVQRTPLPHIWDTLAEAYLAAGQPQKALAASRAALAAGPRQRIAYYHKQLKRFKKAAGLPES